MPYEKRNGVQAWALTTRYVAIGFLLLVVIVTIVLPLCLVFLGGLLKSENGHIVLTVQYIREVVGARKYWLALANTLIIGGGATLVAVTLGVILAWILVRTNVPGASVLEYLSLAPIFIPPMVGAFAWILLAAPRIGAFNSFLRHVGQGELFDIYTRAGIAWVIGIYLAPYVLMIVGSALRSMDPSLEEAAQISGLNRFQTAYRVTLPLVSPAIMSGCVLTLVITIGLFGTPVLLGWSKQILLVTSYIYLEWQAEPPDTGAVSILSIYLVLLSAAAMFLQRWLLKGRSFVTVTGKGYRPRKVRLGGSRYVFLGFVCLYLLLTIVGPLTMVVASALSTYTWSGKFTFVDIAFLWRTGAVRTTLMNSLTIATVAATLATILGVAVSWISCRTTFRGRQFLEYLVLLPVAVPGIAFGIGVAFLWLRVPLDIYGTIWIIVVAYLGRYASYAVRTISSSLIQLHPELEESARISGYGWFRAFWRISLPLVLPSIASSWILLFSIFSTELSMVSILSTSVSRTLSMLTFDTWYNGQFPQVAALSLLQLLVGMVVLLIARGSIRRMTPSD